MIIKIQNMSRSPWAIVAIIDRDTKTKSEPERRIFRWGIKGDTIGEGASQRPAHLVEVSETELAALRATIGFDDLVRSEQLTIYRGGFALAA